MHSKMTALQYAGGALLASSSFFAFTSAQDTNTTGNNDQTCSSDFYNVDYNTPVNATGRVGFRWSTAPNNAKDWYFSTVLNESSIERQGVPYISMPELSSEEICLYKFGALNITATSEAGNNGCEGILTQACINALLNIDPPIRPSGGAGTGLLCGQPDDASIQAACNEGVTGNTIYTTSSTVFNSSTCAVKSPPGVTVPQDYTTFPIGIGYVNKYPKPDNTTMYDLYTRQTVPWVITASFEEGLSETTVVCVAPSNIKQGSRVPQGQWPPGGSGVGPNDTSGRPSGTSDPTSTASESPSAASRGSQCVGYYALLAAGVAMMMSVL